MFSLDGMMKAGTDMMGVASTSFQRAMKVQEVTSTKDENQPGTCLQQSTVGCPQMNYAFSRICVVGLLCVKCMISAGASRSRGHTPAGRADTRANHRGAC